MMLASWAMDDVVEAMKRAVRKRFFMDGIVLFIITWKS